MMNDTEDEPMDLETSIVDEKLKNQNTYDDNDDKIIPTLDELINNDKKLINNSTLSTRWENKNGTFTTGIDIFSKEEKLKMEERAKRFGIIKNTTNNTEHENIDSNILYESMGIIDDIENKKIRLNVLHMRGTDDMSTKDVFKYFEDYGPSSIEWINDVSCNIVWLDNISSARALIHLSKKINSINNDNNDEIIIKNDNIDDESISLNKNNDLSLINDIKYPLPPGIWRKGNVYNKNNNIYLRFATINDKKQQNAEKKSDYYKKYGNPNYGGIKGLLSESKKKSYKQKKRKLSDNNDDDNINKKKSNPWGELSEKWGNNDNLEEYYVVNKKPNLQINNDDYNEVDYKPNIKNRLGIKNNNAIMKNEIINYSNPSEDNCSNHGDNDDTSSASDNNDAMNLRSKIPRMRMHADDEEEKVKRKKLKQITQKKREESRDLRSRLGKKNPQKYRDEIQVIVTNRPDIYRKQPQEEEIEEEEQQQDEENEKMSEESEKEDGELEDDIINDEEKIEKDQLVHDKKYEKEEEGEIDDNDESSSSSSNESESELSEKEIQGPQGSVIKVVPRMPRAKPQVASTVWTRLNFNADKNNSTLNNKGKLGERLRGDLRSRLGNKKRPERSPLRIEVKNEKYQGDQDQDFSD